MGKNIFPSKKQVNGSVAVFVIIIYLYIAIITYKFDTVEAHELRLTLLTIPCLIGYGVLAAMLNSIFDKFRK